MINKEYKNLKSLFISNPAAAIEKSQNLICSATEFDTFKDFYEYHLQNSHISTCQNEWTKPQMSIHCNMCSIDQQSCLCLQCFLNSNHQGHDYIINPNSTGNCDCGDSSSCKRIGFCNKHQGLEDDSHPEEYLDEKLRTILTDTVFKASFSSFKHLLTDDGKKLSIIIQFLSSFLKFGDGFRRLLAISITEKINSYKLFSSIFEASIQFNELLQKFCGLLVNDQLFKANFSKLNYKLMTKKIIPNGIESLISSKERENTEIWDSYWYHSYSPYLFQYNIDHNRWNWVKFCLKGLTYMKEPLKFLGDAKFKNIIPDYFKYAVNLSDAAKYQPNEQTQELFDKLSAKILTEGTSKGVNEGMNDTNIVTSFKDKFEEGYFTVLLYFNFIFYYVIHCFKSKPNLKVDKLIESFDKTIDISKIFCIGKNVVESNEFCANENDKFVKTVFDNEKVDLNLMKDDSYRSFHNGASFFILHPMLHSLACLLREDNLCRIKVANLLYESVYRPLRIKLGIMTLKTVLSMICYHESLIPKINFGAISYLSVYIDRPPMANFGVPLFIPLLQLLIGIENEGSFFGDKEFFAFEMAREIGLFDNFESDEYKDEDIIEKQKQMIFTFLYLSILIVIERTLFNFDTIKFIREQVIFALKSGVNNLNDLNDSYDQFLAITNNESSGLNNIITEVAIARQSSNSSDEKEQFSSCHDILFDLKSGIEINLISAINSFNGEKALMNDEITKHPDELIKIQQFEDEDQYFFKSSEEEEINLSKKLKIHLKDFLITPTVLAVIYHTLRTNSENGTSKLELNDHLAMNILILISKFVRDQKGSSYELFDENVVIDYNSTVVDLISKLKKTIFNYKVDNDDNATIENTLTKKSFKTFLKIKFKCGSNEPKSFIDILSDRGEIGKKVLRQMKVKHKGSDCQQEKDDQIKLKKDRAKKMKDEIMNHYKNCTANFNTTGIQSSDLFTSTQSIGVEKETCSICSTSKKNEVLSFPVYIYRTKFPFIVDKPPVISLDAREALKENDVSNDQIDDSDVLNEEQLNHLEAQYPSIDVMMAQFLHNCPQLAIDDDASEEEINHRKSVIESVRQTYQKKIDNELQIIKDKRKELELLKGMKEEQKKKEELRKEELLKNPNKKVEMRTTPGNLFVIQFGICQHQVHHKCVGEKSDFTCPIDRSHKNGLLPNINDLTNESIFENEGDVTSENLREEFKESINVFIEKYSNFFISLNDRVVDVFVELVKSLSGLIATYETRLRNLPDCLDSTKTFLLSRNLFLTTWYAYRMKGKPKMMTGFNENVSYEIESRLTVFQRFIRNLILSDEIEKNFEKKDEVFLSIVCDFVNEMKTSATNKEICLFLRRVCLVDHFLLQRINDDERFIDWDEVLSAENLSQRFEIDIKTITFSEGREFEFKPFVFMKMPKEFIRFAQSPYNFPIEQTHKLFLINILDYNFMIEHYNELEDESQEIAKNERNLLFIDADDIMPSIAAYFSSKSYPSVLLSIGEAASKVLVVDGRKTVSLHPFYLDRYGCTDIGYTRNQPLFLNDVRYERFMDEVLSGDFSNDLHQF